MSKMTVNEKRCKGCGLCITACPKKIIQISKEKLNEKGYYPARCMEMDKCIALSLKQPHNHLIRLSVLPKRHRIPNHRDVMAGSTPLPHPFLKVPDALCGDRVSLLEIPGDIDQIAHFIQQFYISLIKLFNHRRCRRKHQHFFHWFLSIKNFLEF